MVLIVDDEPMNRKLMEALLHPEGYRTRTAANGIDALASVAALPPDLVLLDVMMPGMDGYAVARTLKSNPTTAGIPIIMLSARLDPEARLEGLEAGAEDFLSKPVDRAEMWLRVRNLLRLKDLTDALAEQGADLERQVIERTAELNRLAHFDSLTGLPNRALFMQTLEKTLALSVEQGSGVGLLFIDIDDFKMVNDTRGHASGDSLLREFGERLRLSVPVRDTVGRLGGDEFGVILLLEDGPAGAGRVAQNVVDAMRVAFELDGTDVTASASVGIALYPDDTDRPDTLLQYADTAMYASKRAGRNTFRFSNALMNSEVQARVRLETALRLAVVEEQFTLHFQPKVQLNTGQVSGFEALLRWDCPGHGAVSPADFIPALETTGLIVRVGQWVIDQACRQISAWRETAFNHLSISVNVSGRQLLDGDLLSDVVCALAEHNVPGHLLELELTESTLMANTETTIQTLARVKEHGVRISIDDFGTGYSSLAYLRRFPIDILKIDMAFVRDITLSAQESAIARAIIRMGHDLDLEVIAEGVETAAQLAFLRRHGCDQMQGYLFSCPLALPELEALMSSAPVLADADPRCPLKAVLLLGPDSAETTALRALLIRDGYRVLSASSTHDGLAMLAEHEVQVLVCDQQISAPGDFLRHARHMYPHARRIVVNGSGDVKALSDAINHGPTHGYYTDPWDPDVVHAAVVKAFGVNYRETTSPTAVVR
ncbi:EAL domain-containing protein [Cryobacterium sp. TMT4-31]|uniref:EAL domain-containing protein n=1 Tax=Cryobacterium sp. TMT4-31 TaxID=1259259 RepID=UPI0018E0B933|nr:EAL domain-containing protein [Cryobacterium sp. TMT4-31]